MPRTESEVLDLIKSMNDGGRVYGFAEFIANLFKDKFIELYLGDSYEEVSVEQISTSYPAVFCGKVIGAYKECLILNCPFASKNKKIELGNIVFISERAIRALNEVDGNGSLEDMFLRSSETLQFANKFKK
jgi:hypothetical protein